MFELIRKRQRYCKTTMAGLERNHKKIPKKNQSTTLETENGITSDKNAVAGEFNTFLLKFG